MTDRRVQIDITVPADPDDNRRKQAPSDDRDPWPWRLFRDEDASLPKLSIEFYDAFTQKSGQDDFKDHEVFGPDNQEIDTDIIIDPVATPVAGTVTRYIQSSQLDLTEELLDKLFPGGQIPFSDKRQCEQITSDEFKANNEVWPVSVLSPDIESTLKTAGGDTHDVLSYNPYYDGDSKGRIFEGQDYLIHEWLRPNITSAELQIKEITSSSVMLHAELFMKTEGGNFTGEFAKSIVEDELQGIWYHTFDTFDTKDDGKFKVTTVPKYDCEDKYVWSAPALKVIGNQKVKVFLARRKWHALLRYTGGVGGDVLIGVTFLAPRDLEMPSARKEGTWELTGTWSQAYWDGTGGYGLAWPGPGFLVQDFEFSGDTKKRNGFWLTQVVPFSVQNKWRPYGDGCDTADIKTEGWFSWRKKQVGDNAERTITEFSIARDGWDQIDGLNNSGGLKGWGEG